MYHLAFDIIHDIPPFSNFIEQFDCSDEGFDQKNQENCGHRIYGLISCPCLSVYIHISQLQKGIFVHCLPYSYFVFVHLELITSAPGCPSIKPKTKLYTAL